MNILVQTSKKPEAYTMIVLAGDEYLDQIKGLLKKSMYEGAITRTLELGMPLETVCVRNLHKLEAGLIIRPESAHWDLMA
ncbi:MAG: hypothetical protein GF392_05570 [Candidatus Omnitrophica bacterium]|nr:hypothetical protein [Candidatus Omnitrophota bacterium]